MCCKLRLGLSGVYITQLRNNANSANVKCKLTTNEVTTEANRTVANVAWQRMPGCDCLVFILLNIPVLVCVCQTPPPTHRWFHLFCQSSVWYLLHLLSVWDDLCLYSFLLSWWHHIVPSTAPPNVNLSGGLQWEEVKTSGWLSRHWMYFFFHQCVGGNVKFLLEVVTSESPDSLLSQQVVAEYGSPIFASPEGVASVGTLRLWESNISHMLTVFVHWCLVYWLEDMYEHTLSHSHSASHQHGHWQWLGHCHMFFRLYYNVLSTVLLIGLQLKVLKSKISI